MRRISTKVIERLLIYRRLLRQARWDAASHIYSHQIARWTGYSAAQIRRDLMEIGYHGSSAHGYHTGALLESLDEYVDISRQNSLALAGLGHLGIAVLDNFTCCGADMHIEVAFDNDPEKINRVYYGCRCFHTDEIERVLTEQNVLVGILAVPPEEAQTIAERFVAAGITSLINYTMEHLFLPDNIYVEQIDLLNSLEKALFYARHTRVV